MNVGVCRASREVLHDIYLDIILKDFTSHKLWQPDQSCKHTNLSSCIFLPPSMRCCACVMLMYSSASIPLYRLPLSIMHVFCTLLLLAKTSSGFPPWMMLSHADKQLCAYIHFAPLAACLCKPTLLDGCTAEHVQHTFHIMCCVRSLQPTTLSRFMP